MAEDTLGAAEAIRQSLENGADAPPAAAQDGVRESLENGADAPPAATQDWFTLEDDTVPDPVRHAPPIRRGESADTLMTWQARQEGLSSRQGALRRMSVEAIRTGSRAVTKQNGATAPLLVETVQGITQPAVAYASEASCLVMPAVPTRSTPLLLPMRRGQETAVETCADRNDQTTYDLPVRERGRAAFEKPTASVDSQPAGLQGMDDPVRRPSRELARSGVRLRVLIDGPKWTTALRPLAVAAAIPFVVSASYSLLHGWRLVMNAPVLATPSAPQLAAPGWQTVASSLEAKTNIEDGTTTPSPIPIATASERPQTEPTSHVAPQVGHRKAKPMILLDPGFDKTRPATATPPFSVAPMKRQGQPTTGGPRGPSSER